MKIHDRSGKKLRIGDHAACVRDVNAKIQGGGCENLRGNIFIIDDVIKSKLKKGIFVQLSSTADSREQVTISKYSLDCFSKLRKNKNQNESI